MARSKGGYPKPIELEPGDVAADLAHMFNELIARLEAEDAKRGFEARTRALQDADRLKREQAQREELERRRALEVAIVERISQVLEATREGDLTRRVDARDLDGALQAVSGGVDGLLDLVGRMIGDVGGYARELREAIDSQSAVAQRMSITAKSSSAWPATPRRIWTG